MEIVARTTTETIKRRVEDAVAATLPDGFWVKSSAVISLSNVFGSKVVITVEIAPIEIAEDE